MALKNTSRFFLTMVGCTALLAASACGYKFPTWEGMENDPLDFVADPPPASEGLNTSDKVSPPTESIPLVAETLQTTPLYEARPNGEMGALGFNLESYLNPEQDLKKDERIERLEEAVIRLQKDLAVMGRAVQDRGQPVQNVSSVQTKPVPLAKMNNEPVEMIEDGIVPVKNVDAVLVDAASLKHKMVAPHNQGLTNELPVDKGPRPLATESGGVKISGIRVGEHPGYVRLVFDITGQTPYTVDLDNAEKLLLVEMPEASWETPVTSENFEKMPVVSSYAIQPVNDGRGRVIVANLKSSTQVLSKSVLPALSGGGKRIVIDLAK